MSHNFYMVTVTRDDKKRVTGVVLFRSILEPDSTSSFSAQTPLPRVAVLGDEGSELHEKNLPSAGFVFEGNIRVIGDGKSRRRRRLPPNDGNKCCKEAWKCN